MSDHSPGRFFYGHRPNRLYSMLRAIIALAISIFCIIALKQIFGLTYAVNDDIGMMEIAAGVTTLKPDIHF
ncbi:MAG TPA: hypothetical protein GX717_06155, partial [Clostridiaceae bacterium]|nr:hypothetical protein [Clostridiaceae bacterium]